MPRRPRHLQAGIYHVTSHGSDTRLLFLSDEDREDFLKRLALSCDRFELALISWVLLGNHYHALVRISDARLSLALQWLHTEYSRHHNRRHGRSAHLFEAHPYTGEIESDEQLVAAARYLARNPVKGGLVDDPVDLAVEQRPDSFGTRARADSARRRRLARRLRWPRLVALVLSADSTSRRVGARGLSPAGKPCIRCHPRW